MKTALNTSQTKAAKARAKEDYMYIVSDKEVTKSIRKDKQDHIDNLAKQVEEAARQGNLKELYMVTKRALQQNLASRHTSQ